MTQSRAIMSVFRSATSGLEPASPWPPSNLRGQTPQPLPIDNETAGLGPAASGMFRRFDYFLGAAAGAAPALGASVGLAAGVVATAGAGALAAAFGKGTGLSDWVRREPITSARWGSRARPAK